MTERHPENLKSVATWTRTDRETFSFLELVWLAHVAETKSEATRLQSEWLVKIRDSELRVGFADPATSDAIPVIIRKDCQTSPLEFESSSAPFLVRGHKSKLWRVSQHGHDSPLSEYSPTRLASLLRFLCQ
jgi:hypothetical protein